LIRAADVVRDTARIMKRTVLILLATLPFVIGLAAQNAPAVADADWPMYSRDAAGTRFSPLTQITPANVSRLQQAWTVQLAAPGGRGGGRTGGRGADPFGNTGSNPAATPIVIDGVMYLPAGGNKVLALEAHTGKDLWRHELPRQFNNSSHGVAYWPGERGTAPRILMTAGPRLIALDAATGARAAGFGTDRRRGAPSSFRAAEPNSGPRSSRQW
jgi:glucose dehydrogenase